MRAGAAAVSLALAAASPAGCAASRYGAVQPRPGAAASARVVWQADDPAGDDDGPGSYVYPASPWLQPGALDLRHVEVRQEGEVVTLRFSFARPIETHVRPVAEDERAKVFDVQVDLYLDADGEAGTGRARGLPGRRVVLGDGLGWERAVVATPVPARVRDALRRWPELARRVLVPSRPQVRGRTLEVRVPATLWFGSQGEQPAGGAVCVTGAVFGTGLGGRLGSGEDAHSLYVRDVTKNPGSCGNWSEDALGRPCTFGGCDPCGRHPRCIDVLDAPDRPQHEALASYARRGDGTAVLPVVRLRPAPASQRRHEPRGRPAGAVVVQGVQGQVVTAVWPPGRPVPALGSIARLFDALGAGCGSAVVTLVRRRVVVLEALQPLSATPHWVLFEAGGRD